MNSHTYPEDPISRPILVALVLGAAVAFLALAGCQPPEAPAAPAPVKPIVKPIVLPTPTPLTAKDIGELRRAIDDLGDEVRAGRREPDLSPLLEEIRRLKPEAMKSVPYTGCKVYVSANKGSCIPCDRFVRDVHVLAANSNWRVGYDASCHFWLVETLEGLTPRFEYYRDGKLIAELSDYGAAPGNGFEGNITRIVDQHPNLDRAREIEMRQGSTSSESYGSYGSTGGYATGGYVVGTYTVGPVVGQGSDGGSFSTGFTAGNGSQGGSYSVPVVPPRRVVRTWRSW